MTSADAAAEIAYLKAALARRDAELSGANLLIAQLTAQLAVLRRMQFGRSSEKLTAEVAARIAARRPALLSVAERSNADQIPDALTCVTGS